MKHLVSIALITLTLLSGTSRGLAQGTFYLFNLNWSNPGGGLGDIEDVFPGGVPYGTYDAHFRTGAGTYSLNTVTLEFLFMTGEDTMLPARNLAVQLFQPTQSGSVFVGDLGNAVVKPLTTPWPPGSFPGAFTVFFDFTPVRPITLIPSSDYMLVSSMPADSPVSASLIFSKTSSYVSRGGWTMSPTTSGNPFVNEHGEYLVMAVNATLIPEPGSAFLLISGIALPFRVARSRSWQLKEQRTMAMRS